MNDDDIIRVGDLVAVIASMPCCVPPNGDPDLGKVFSVKSIVPENDWKGTCVSCGTAHRIRSELYESPDSLYFHRSMLQKIKPPKQESSTKKELEHEKQREVTV